MNVHSPARVPTPRPVAHVWVLVGLVGLCVGVGALEGLMTRDAIRSWYAALQQPAWTPPNAAFGPVWTTLFVLMGVAGWLVYRAPAAPARRRAWQLWWMQLLLNWAWTPLFFNARQVGVALVVIVVLWCTIMAFVRVTWSTDRTAALLFLPYLAWVGYASSLNAGILWLN